MLKKTGLKISLFSLTFFVLLLILGADSESIIEGKVTATSVNDRPAVIQDADRFFLFYSTKNNNEVLYKSGTADSDRTLKWSSESPVMSLDGSKKLKSGSNGKGSAAVLVNNRVYLFTVREDKIHYSSGVISGQNIAWEQIGKKIYDSKSVDGSLSATVIDGKIYLFFQTGNKVRQLSCLYTSDGTISGCDNATRELCYTFTQDSEGQAVTREITSTGSPFIFNTGAGDLLLFGEREKNIDSCSLDLLQSCNLNSDLPNCFNYETIVIISCSDDTQEQCSPENYEAHYPATDKDVFFSSVGSGGCLIYVNSNNKLYYLCKSDVAVKEPETWQRFDPEILNAARGVNGVVLNEELYVFYPDKNHALRYYSNPIFKPTSLVEAPVLPEPPGGRP